MPPETARRPLAAGLARQLANNRERAQPLDLALARWLAEHDPAHPDVLAATGLLLSWARAHGHAGLRLEAHAGRPAGETDLRLPPLDAWEAALAASGLVGAPGQALPLIRDGGRLYLHRYWHAEQRVAARLAARLAHAAEAPAGEHHRLREAFAALFPEAGASREAPDWQAVAAAAALHRRLTLIAGGPGTGKTTTVVRLLAVLLTAEPDLRIALAAPTGKAAHRLKTSIAAQAETLTVPEPVRDAIRRAAGEAATLHRLLGFRPRAARFARDERHPLAADVVLVDEASMIDLLLFDALLAATPESARLILLGDPGQLASVEAGFVFGDLCRAGEGEAASGDFAAHARALGVAALPPPDPLAPPLRDVVVTLRKTYRFGPDSGIGRLATALRDGRADDAVETLRDPAFPDAQLVSDTPAGLRDELITRLAPFARALCRAGSPAEAIERIDDVRLLAATRWGPRGIHALNRLIEEWLLEQGLRSPGANYRGRPIMITHNSYDVELFNGDVGVMWWDGDRLVGCFPDPAGGVRRVPRHRLPPHESAWAMTVHKSQGSEFDRVLLMLPETPSDMLTRELLYTAVTRAKADVTIFGEAAVVRAAASRGEDRESGLAARLAY